MNGPILLDTHAALWFGEGTELLSTARAAIDKLADQPRSLLVSPISAWEVSLLVSRGKLGLAVNPRTWFRRLVQLPNVAATELSAEVLVASNELPGELHRDPVDRILVATARESGLTLMTRDQKLLDYSEQGFVRTLPC